MSPSFALVLVTRPRERTTAIAVPLEMPSVWQMIVAEAVGSARALTKRFRDHNSGPTCLKETHR